MSQLLSYQQVWGDVGLIPAGLTRFLSPGTFAVGVTELRVRVPTACRIGNLSVRLLIAPGGVETLTVTLRKNGADTAGAVTITGAAITGALLTVVSYAAGDDYSLKIAASALSIAAGVAVTFDVLSP